VLARRIRTLCCRFRLLREGFGIPIAGGDGFPRSIV
jgi:hypothetical protein